MLVRRHCFTSGPGVTAADYCKCARGIIPRLIGSTQAVAAHLWGRSEAAPTHPDSYCTHHFMSSKNTGFPPEEKRSVCPA